MTLVSRAMELDWTSDPFDRLIVAHSRPRRTPLCTLDRTVRTQYSLFSPELSTGNRGAGVPSDTPINAGSQLRTDDRA